MAILLQGVDRQWVIVPILRCGIAKPRQLIEDRAKVVVTGTSTIIATGAIMDAAVD